MIGPPTFGASAGSERKGRDNHGAGRRRRRWRDAVGPKTHGASPTPTATFRLSTLAEQAPGAQCA
eukprot:9014632-Pyramimonas_sp.AAC.1